MKRNVKTSIAVISIFIGLCLLLSTYFNTKKHEVFDEMNELYYEKIISLETENVNVEPNELEEDLVQTNNEEVSNDTLSQNDSQTNSVIDYSKYYIGTLEIPKISLKRGFFDKDSRYNNVNRNLFVHSSSEYPDEKNGNLIILSHSGTSSISYFKNLYKLTLEDDVYVSYNGISYHYKIKNIYTDTKDGNIKIVRDKSKKTVTLITCTKNDKTTQTIYIAEEVND